MPGEPLDRGLGKPLVTEPGRQEHKAERHEQRGVDDRTEQDEHLCQVFRVVTLHASQRELYER